MMDSQQVYEGESLCIICNSGLTQTDNKNEKLITLTEKSLIDASVVRKNTELKTNLENKLRNVSIIQVHVNCRKRYADLRGLLEMVPPGKKVKTTRSNMPYFDWKLNCLFCEQTVTRKEKSGRVETLEIKEKILKKCKENNPCTSLPIENIHHRVLNCHDLVAVEAIYHQNCLRNFFKEMSTPESKNIKGRPEDLMKQKSFQEMCELLESSGPISLHALQEKVMEKYEEDDMFSVKWIRKKLEEKYEDNITFTSDGYRTVVCLKELAALLINDRWYANRKQNILEESERIVMTAAKLIKAEINKIKSTTEKYPSDISIADVMEGQKYIPTTLKTFLKELITSEIKVSSLGQCITYAARPKSVIPPVLFGLGVECDHLFGSKWLVNELYRLGFSISSEEVGRYKQSVLSENIEDNMPQGPQSFTQWTADNADHNTATLDGKDTFHGMGIIASSIHKNTLHHF